MPVERNNELAVTNKFQIREFPIHKMKPESKIIVIGKPGSGKSTLIKDMFYHDKHFFPVAKVQSGTESDNGFFREFIPDIFIENEYNAESIQRFIDRQRQHKKDMDNPWAILCIDDCMDDNKEFGKKLWQGIFKLSRHWKMKTILSLQYCLDLTPKIRTLTDYIFIFNEKFEETRVKLHKNFASVVGNFATFNQLMDQVAENYTCIVIDNKAQSNKIEDCVFYYKAKEHPNFKFGCPEIWEWNAQRYESRWEEIQAS